MSNTRPRQLPLPLRLDDEATFANFLAIESNSQLLQHLAHPLQQSQYVWLWGVKGAGCTHLLQAVCHQNESQELPSLYIPLQCYTELAPQIFENLDSMALVCLDEVESIAGMPEWETALFNLYNQLAEAGKRLVVAAKLPPVQVAWQLPDLASRLQSGLVFQLHGLDDEAKSTALQLRANARGFELPAEVAEFLLQRSERDMSSLFNMLQKLDDISLEKKRRITIPLLKELL